MVNNKNKRIVKTGKRSSRRRSRVPRPRSLFSGAYRTVIRVMWDVGQAADSDGSSFTALIDVGYIVPHGHSGLSTLFKSIRVHSMDAKFYSAFVKMDEIGFVAMNFGDVDEIPTSNTIPGILASPGNSIATAGKVVRGRWYPTEPSDREFIDMVQARSHTWARINIAVWPEKATEWFSAKAAKIHLLGKVIVDIDCTFRGQGSSLSARDGRCLCTKCADRPYNPPVVRRHVVINGVLEEIIPDDPPPNIGTSPQNSFMIESPPGEEFENLELI